jgi:hypothetical protein
MSRRQRHVTDPTVIAQVIENGHRIAEDLGITLFCWSRTQNNFSPTRSCCRCGLCSR